MTSIKILFLLLFVKGIMSVCKESYIVICDDLLDVKKNDSWTWKFVLIGSDQFKHQPPRHSWKSYSGFTRTQSLTIIYQLNFIHPLALTTSTQLEYLNLYDNELREIEDYTFANMPKLRNLLLENNQIEHLGRSVFKNNTLDYVSLSRNQLRSIRTCFSETKIKWLKINRNQLTFIKSESFPKTLERLELDHNLLAYFDADVFKNLVNLKELSIRYNRLTTLPDISFLRLIHYLHFSYNRIRACSYPFDAHKELEFLDLSSNLIENFDVERVSSNGTPPLVLLMFNRLTNLNFVDPQKKTDLALFGNPLVCDCYFKIEKILKDYKHYKTCDTNFAKSKMPVCIYNGKCGESKLKESDIKNFVEAVSGCENKDECVFRL